MSTNVQDSRRNFLRHFVAATTMGGFAGLASGQHVTGDVKSAEAAKRAWLKEATVDRDFPGEPVIYSQFNDEIFYLRAPLLWTPTDKGTGLPSVTVPAGFVTDLASIPPPFWSVLPRDGRYMPAAIVHDYLYWQQEFKKDTADAIFKMAMYDLDVGSLQVAAIYAGTRTPFGDWAWQNNAKLKAAGEQRILKNFPPRQNIKWSEWKLNNANFEPAPSSPGITR